MRCSFGQLRCPVRRLRQHRLPNRFRAHWRGREQACGNWRTAALERGRGRFDIQVVPAAILRCGDRCCLVGWVRNGNRVSRHNLLSRRSLRFWLLGYVRVGRVRCRLSCKFLALHESPSVIRANAAHAAWTRPGEQSIQKRLEKLRLVEVHIWTCVRKNMLNRSLTSHSIVELIHTGGWGRSQPPPCLTISADARLVKLQRCEP